MNRALVCWIGKADLRAPDDQDRGLGPIGQAVAVRPFDTIHLLSDHPKELVAPYLRWLQARTPTSLTLHPVRLSSPTHFGDIYRAAVAVVSDVWLRLGPASALTYHLSPGTPAMAAVWIILAKTRFPGELIESSPEAGVQTASVPFDISADFLPDLLRKPDEELKRLSAGLPPEAPEFADILHRSVEMKRVVAKARRVAPRSVPVLIEGESGTGKELLARAIHAASPRRAKGPVVVNCGAIPAELVEAELFGHKKGAFTGASEARKGYFEAADGNTLFLDEIGELPLRAQVKLLRVLQEGEIVRVGSSDPIRVDVRIIAATNRNLMEEVAAGRFRLDLYYRLAVAILRLPPLCGREGDLGLLVDRLLDQVNQESATEPGYQKKELSAAARNLLLQQRWPGNVRELLNTLRRAAIWCSEAAITKEDVQDALLPAPARRSDDVLGKPLGEGLELPELLASVARHYLERSLAEAHGNKTKAAELVGLPSYQTFTNWLERYGVAFAGAGKGSFKSRRA
ncbi:MAG: sigma 54-interacting transcriptional regulator [Deltaproteobacteria bacterium]|nr:sigma 54-interacting transcriptional regulator [Deltaproteobacteria bacterium]